MHEWQFRSGLIDVWIYGMLCAYMHPGDAVMKWIDERPTPRCTKLASPSPSDALLVVDHVHDDGQTQVQHVSPVHELDPAHRLLPPAKRHQDARANHIDIFCVMAKP